MYEYRLRKELPTDIAERELFATTVRIHDRVPTINSKSLCCSIFHIKRPEI